jgi:3-oxoacyl-[acyl-carrier protein] reductase
MKFKDKVCLITGSSRGFGAKISEKFAQEGANVVITFLEGDSNEAKNAKIIAKKINSELIIPVDVRKRDSVKNMMRIIKEKYGKIDVLVNNAGINHTADFDKQTDEEWNQVLSVDLKGVFICCQEVLPYISKNGKIINIGSISGEYGGPRSPAYAVAKAGVMALTHNLARFVGKMNITVNCVSPGMIESPFLDKTMPKNLKDSLFPDILLQRMGTSEEVAGTVIFLASDDAGYITGQTIGVNGGLWVR